MKVGFVGFGKVAEVFHAPLVRAETALELTHVVERHRNRSQELIPHIEVLRSAQELFQSPVELVVILTPNQSHFPLAREALICGKHVVLDKPMTLTSGEADELIKLAEQHERTLSVFHNRRWDNDFLTLQKLLAEGTLGRLVHLESRFDRFRPQLKGGWRESTDPGAGLLYDLGSHLLDQALILFGPPVSISADLRVERDKAKALDAFDILLSYPSHRVSLHSSCLAGEGCQRFRARGTERTWLKLGLDPQEARLKDGATPGGKGWGLVEPDKGGQLYRGNGVGQPHPTEPGDYPAFYRQLADSIERGTEPPVTAREGRDVMRAIELCEQSAREGRSVPWS